MSGAKVRPFTAGGRRFAAIVLPLRAEAEARPLTPAEREVAELLRLGLTNAEIARRRGRSPRTVANQIASLMRKLSADSRLQVVLRMSGG